MLDEESHQRKSPWNSLEVAKLLAGSLTPLVIVAIGFWIQSTLARQDQAWKAREHLAERRLTLYDDIRDELNRIYCFVEEVGTWKEDTPESVVGYKRLLDQVMHTQRAIWAPDTFQAYLTYMDTAFATYQGVAADAKIRTSVWQKKNLASWDSSWEERLTGEVHSDHRQRYEALVELISRDLMLMSEGS